MHVLFNILSNIADYYVRDSMKAEENMEAEKSLIAQTVKHLQYIYIFKKGDFFILTFTEKNGTVLNMHAAFML